MKRLFFAVAAMLFAACTTDAFEEVSIVRPQTITVSLEDNSRIQLSEGKSIWTEGDLVTVFYRSNYPQKWQFQGQTGNTTGTLLCVDDNLPEMEPNRDDIVTVYPHNDNISLNDVSMMLELPAEQTYLKDSFGTDGTLMVSVSKDNNAKLSSVLGWVMLQLTGSGETVSSVSFKGNSHEQIAGLVTINISDLSSTMRFSSLSVEERENLPDTFKSVTLNCPEGVVLSDKATTFYIALPPQTFSNGFTVTILCEDGSKMTKSTEKSVTIKRNTILPMDSVETDFESVPNNQIWYTTEEGRALSGLNFEYQSNTYENGLGIITFENDVTVIADEAFANSDVTAVYLPKCVQTIGKSAFSYCEKLEKVNLPDALTLISESAFENCLSITKVVIPNGVTEIGDNAFYGCESIAKLSFATPEAVRSTTNNLKRVGHYAFCNCYKITDIVLPQSVTTIGDGAFRCCGIKVFTVPPLVSEIGEGVFANCQYLMAYYGRYASVDSKCLIMDGTLKAFANADIKNYTLPGDVDKIGENAFAGNDKIENIGMSNYLTHIGDSAFEDCINLKSITLSAILEHIGVNAFENCFNLQSIYIPNSVQTIGLGAFIDCSSLKSVTFGTNCQITYLPEDCFKYCEHLKEFTIPSSITKLGVEVLSGCFNLQKIYCEAKEPPKLEQHIEDPDPEDGKLYYTFEIEEANPTIYVPRKSLDEYKATAGWSEYASRIEPYDVIE